eukprot:scaffold654862_cov42-Prasinocladus_malaysianus.AAC.1
MEKSRKRRRLVDAASNAIGINKPSQGATMPQRQKEVTVRRYYGPQGIGDVQHQFDSPLLRPLC